MLLFNCLITFCFSLLHTKVFEGRHRLMYHYISRLSTLTDPELPLNKWWMKRPELIYSFNSFIRFAWGMLHQQCADYAPYWYQQYNQNFLSTLYSMEESHWYTSNLFEFWRWSSIIPQNTGWENYIWLRRTMYSLTLTMKAFKTKI